MDTENTPRRPFPPRRSPVRVRDGFAAIGGQVIEDQVIEDQVIETRGKAALIDFPKAAAER